MKITVGIPQQDREAAAALYWEAFGTKLHFTLGPKSKALRYVQAVLRADHGICAYDENGRLVGVVGFKTAQGALVGGDFADMRRIYGWISATLRCGLLGLLQRDVENTRFLMDGLFVAADARGTGVGTALLDAFSQEARRRGYRQVRLDVVDTNPRAKALYLQTGFKEQQTTDIGFLRYFYGFRRVTCMVKDVAP